MQEDFILSKMTAIEKELREMLNFSQAERNIASPSIKVLRKIAEALDTEVSYFFEKSEVREISLVERRKEGEPINNNGLLIQRRCEKCGWINSYRFECIDNSLSEDSLERKHE